MIKYGFRLFLLMTNQEIDLFYRISYYSSVKIRFQEIMYTILLKGTGDLFQEINAVCRYGGYINEPTYIGNIIKWNWGTGNVKRLFLANDQPSGCRFIFFRKFGQLAEINRGAFGGYWGDSKKLMYYHGAGTTRATIMAIYAGVGGGNTRQTKKKRLIRRTKKRLIIRKNKRQTKKR
jgi:hypothetical protein